MSPRYIAILLLCLLAACNSEEVEKAPVDTKKMTSILTDLQLAEVYSSMVDDSLHRIMPKNQDSLAVYYTEVLAHHGLTEEEFNEAIDWYKSHPMLLDTVYKNMVSALSMSEGMLKEWKDKEEN